MTCVHCLIALDAVTAAAEVPVMMIPSGICFLPILSEAEDRIRTTAAVQDLLENLREGLPAHQARTVATDRRAAMAATLALMAVVPAQTAIATAARGRGSTENICRLDSRILRRNVFFDCSSPGSIFSHCNRSPHL
jgi:hypothetical protein